MSAALIAALRESDGYLRDDGYHQTAQLMALAADEIERLNRRIHARLKQELRDRGRRLIVSQKSPRPHPASKAQRASSSKNN